MANELYIKPDKATKYRFIGSGDILVAYVETKFAYFSSRRSFYLIKLRFYD